MEPKHTDSGLRCVANAVKAGLSGIQASPFLNWAISTCKT